MNIRTILHLNIRKNSLLISLIIFFFFSFYFLRILNKEKNLIDGLNNELFMCNEKYRNIIKLENNIIQQYSTTSKISNLCLTIDNKKLLDIIGENPKIVLRISELNCTDCIKKVVELLENEIREPLIKEKVIVLYSSFTPIDIVQTKKSFNIDFNFYNIKKQHTGLNIDELNEPYLFICNPNLFIDNVFVPIINMPEITTTYLKYIINQKLSDY